MANLPTTSRPNENERVIMERSWLHPIEWLFPCVLLIAWCFWVLIYALLRQPVGPMLSVGAGSLAMERFAWAAHRLWRLKRRTVKRTR